MNPACLVNGVRVLSDPGGEPYVLLEVAQEGTRTYALTMEQAADVTLALVELDVDRFLRVQGPEELEALPEEGAELAHPIGKWMAAAAAARKKR